MENRNDSLTRPNMASVFSSGLVQTSNLRKNPHSKLHTSLNSLNWRQKFQNERFYKISLKNGASLKIEQITNGEMKGIGTGSMVWPAAHVLIKYLEKETLAANWLLNKRVCDIGAGTGCAGLALTALGARVTLTDQEELLPLMERNLDRAYTNSPGLIDLDNVEVIIHRHIEHNWIPFSITECYIYKILDKTL